MTLLSPAEVAHLTGYARPSKQVEWLRAKGIDHYVNPLGHPIVRASALGIPEPEGACEPVAPLPERPSLLLLSEITAMRKRYRIGDGDEGPGVYFLFDADKLLYIGRSVDIEARLRAHFIIRVDRPHEAIWFNEAAWQSVPEIHLPSVEGAYIRRERPPRNRMGVPPRSYR